MQLLRNFMMSSTEYLPFFFCFCLNRLNFYLRLCHIYQKHKLTSYVTCIILTDFDCQCKSQSKRMKLIGSIYYSNMILFVHLCDTICFTKCYLATSILIAALNLADRLRGFKSTSFGDGTITCLYNGFQFDCIKCSMVFLSQIAI